MSKKEEHLQKCAECIGSAIEALLTNDYDSARSDLLMAAEWLVEL